MSWYCRISRRQSPPSPSVATARASSECVLVGIAEQESNQMKQEMLINVAQPEECRIAIVEDGALEELYVERAGQDNYVGNIYKGVVVNLEPSIQAAFIDFGVGRNGFLHVSDLESQYFRQGGFDPAKSLGPSGPRRPPQRTGDSDVGDEFEEGRDGGPDRPKNYRFGGRPRFKPPIQEILRRGDEVLVQVIKEGIGTKGPTLSTYISIPGRYLVLMPALGRVGVSRKIEDETVRRRLRDVMLELNPPKGVGFIVRTAGADRTKRELSRDMAYLLRLWKVIARRIKKLPAPAGIYEESDMIIRTIRDIVTGDVDAIYIDEPAAHDRAKEFLQLVMPRYVHRLQMFEGKEPLFRKYNLDEEIAKIHRRRVPLRSGGSIVIDQTEALVAIDVNSGSFRAEGDAEESAYQMNMHAAKEIARQIRLRDLGGVIVNDFIDMRKEKHRHGIERALRDCHEARPRPHENPPHQPLRPDRDDPPAHPHQPQAQRLHGMPKLRRLGGGEDAGEHGDRRRPFADPRQPARAGRQGDAARLGRGGRFPQQPQAARTSAARRGGRDGDPSHRRRRRRPRTSGHRMPRCGESGSEVSIGLL